MIFFWEVPFYFLRVPQRPGSPTRQPITVISGGRSIGNSGCTSWSAPLCACQFPTGARGACWCRAKLCDRSVSAHKHQAKQRRARKPTHWPALVCNSLGTSSGSGNSAFLHGWGPATQSDFWHIFWHNVCLISELSHSAIRRHVYVHVEWQVQCQLSNILTDYVNMK